MLATVVALCSSCFFCIVRLLESSDYSPSILFIYLENRPIQKDKSQIWKCIRSAADGIFQMFLDIVEAKVKSTYTALQLESGCPCKS